LPTESSTFYHTEGASRREDGTIVLHATWYDCDERGATHTIGWVEIAPDDPDHGLWEWVLPQGDRFEAILGPDDLKAMREAYREERGAG
jgi:hypothetical protein